MNDNQEDQIMQKFESEFGRGMLLSERFVMKETVLALRQEQPDKPVVDVEIATIEYGLNEAKNFIEDLSDGTNEDIEAITINLDEALQALSQIKAGHLAQGWQIIDHSKPELYDRGYYGVWLQNGKFDVHDVYLDQVDGEMRTPDYNDFHSDWTFADYTHYWPSPAPPNEKEDL